MIQKEEKNNMANRERKHELKVFLSDDEHRILEGKFKLSDKRSRSDFIRQLIIEGMSMKWIIHTFGNITHSLVR